MMLDFFTRPPGSYLTFLGVALLLLFWYGRHEFDRGKASVKAQEAKAATRIVNRQSQITSQVSKSFDAARIADASATQSRLQKVRTHVSPKADAGCSLPLGFVRLFNDAAHGAVPQAAAGPDDAASGIALSDVARTSVENDGQYDQIAGQLKALQDWILEQEALRP
jgi:hypothetical protein